MKKLVVLVLLAGIVSMPAHQAFADRSISDVVVTILHINPVRNAVTIGDKIRECFQNTACATALGAVASSLGVPSAALTLAKTGAAYTAKPGGEGTEYNFLPVNGYKICRVEINTISVNPPGGDRASDFYIFAAPDRILIKTWTPRKPPSHGRSWYDGFVSVVQAKETALGSLRTQGKCTVPENGSQYECRGSRGVSHGHGACSGIHAL